jgi:uncharacterized LabA/DUF88 family protein
MAVYIDNANLIHSPRYLGWCVGLKNISNFFKKSKKLQAIRLFDSIPEKEDLDKLLKKENGCFTKKDYDKYLKRSLKQREFLKMAEEKWGIDVNLKPLRFIYDKKKKRYEKKGDCDVDLTVEAIRRRKSYDTLFLLSGDGDYVALVNYLKQCKKEVIIMSTRGLIANILVKAANDYIDFRTLKTELFLKRKRL